MKQTVVISFLGTQLDAGAGPNRWDKWRPTVALAQHQDLLINQLIVFYNAPYTALLDKVVQDVQASSPTTHISPLLMHMQNPWDFGEVYSALYDWAQSYTFNPEQFDYWVHITTGTHVVQICLFLLVEARLIPGVLLQTSPPRGKHGGNPGHYELINLDLSQYDAIAARLSNAQDSAVNVLKDGISTRNAQFNQLIEELERVAVRSTAPILLTGPTGAGKGHLASRVFALKKARHTLNGAFVSVNCATLRGDMAASALFGHTKGAFTGAGTERAGLLRAAQGGLLFLDEIGELGLDEQAMLLKAIEEKEVLPVGADRPVKCDFQLIAGTHRDLHQDVLTGQFRADLLARINVWAYQLPSLADRREDIEPNIDYLLAQWASAHKPVRFHVEAKHSYMQFALSPAALWAGNFRDLSASMTRLCTLAEGGRISLGDVAAEIVRLQKQWHHLTEARTNGLPMHNNHLLAQCVSPHVLEGLDLFDRCQLETVLHICQTSRSLSDAGRTLFAQSRTQRKSQNDADRLKKYLAKFELSWEQLKQIQTS